MKVDDLKVKLDKLGISSNAYHLYGPGSGDEYCIEHGPKGWIIYYHERGNKDIIGIYDNEEEACEFFLKTISKDKSTRLP
jgi:hypothetical protein